MRLSALTIGACALLACGTANAADPYSSSSNGGLKDGTIAAQKDGLAGFYVGVNGGYGWGGGVNFHDSAAYTGKNGVPYVDDMTSKLSPTGGFGGGGIGYNFLSGNLLIGFEADVQGGDISDSGKISVLETGNLTHAGALTAGTNFPTTNNSGIVNTNTTVTDIGTATVPTCTGAACGSYTVTPSGGTTGTTTQLATGANTITLAPGDTLTWSGVPSGTKLTAISQESWKTGDTKSTVDWFATVRGKIGYKVAPGLAPYLTGGLAIGGVKNTATIDTSTFSNSDTRTGWVIGGGLEWAFAPNWSVKAEYLHIDFGSASLAGAVPTGVTLTSNKVDNSLDIARVGVNLHLNGAFAPLN